MNLILKQLKKYASVNRKRSNEWFFKTGVGQYGYGDKFLGVDNPSARKVAEKFSEINFSAIKNSLNSEIHEERLVAILILVRQYEKSLKSGDKNTEEKIAKFYLKNLSRVNNWDLVDLSAHKILGKAIINGISSGKLLDTLAISKNMWFRRVAIISTMAMIKEGDFKPTLRIAQKLLGDREDLMHKAVGWTLREVWKKDSKICEEFLLTNYTLLPRTTLRYAIERMPEPKRKKFLNLKNNK